MMRVKLNDKEIKGVTSIEIVTGPNCLYIESDANHSSRNFDIQAMSSGCDSCEAFVGDPCTCEADKYGHVWVDRGTCVCPFKCKNCKVLSGTNDAFKPCISSAKGK
jgi:hypothetical protein